MSFCRSVLPPVLIAIIAVVAAVCVVPRRVDIPAHLLNHPIVDLKQFLDDKTVEDLLALTRSASPITTAAREYDSYAVLRDDIGEAVPMPESGQCPPGVYLIPNGPRTKCVLPGRVDVAYHFMRSGGFDGLKEYYETLVGRIQPFQHYIFNTSKHEVSKRMMADPKFLSLAKAVCPADRQVLDPFQLNLIAQVPGQTVATHLDAPYFFDASRFHYPQWFLATMVFSGLFKDSFVNQVQIVAYYHKWVHTPERAGGFYYWASSNLTAHEALPISRSANSVDGSKVVHTAATYMPARKPPPMTVGEANSLVYTTKAGDKGHKWAVKVGAEKVIGNYDEDELRFSVVYRARCFRDDKELAAYKKTQDTPRSLESIIEVFRRDLVAKGLLEEHQHVAPYDFAMLLLQTYVKYPLPSKAVVPYNYCMLARGYPALKPLLSFVCA